MILEESEIPLDVGAVAPADCHHPQLWFGSGDYYVFCRHCGGSWMRQNAFNAEYGTLADGRNVGGSPGDANQQQQMFDQSVPRVMPPAVTEGFNSRSATDQMNAGAAAAVEGRVPRFGFRPADGTPVTNAQFAEWTGRMAAYAASFGADSLTLKERLREPVSPDAVARFTERMSAWLEAVKGG